MLQGKQIREHLNTTLDSEIFKHIFIAAFRPLVREWKRRILQDLALSDDTRRGLIIAYNEMYAGFLTIYEECQIDPPEWLHKEFDRNG